MKKVFEDDLISGMQQELRKQASAEQPDLVKAAECLHAALEIFEQSGMQSQADGILRLLSKIAHDPNRKTRHVQHMPSMPKLMEAGLTQHDIKEFAKGSPIAKAKFNMVLRQLGYSDKSIADIIGTHNVVPEKDAKDIIDPNRGFSQIWEYFKDPMAPTSPEEVKNKEEKLEKPEVIEFKSLAGRTPSRPDHISDRHTKGLTSDKMIANLKDHGHMMNKADDNAVSDNFEEEYAKWLNYTRKTDKLKNNTDPKLAEMLNVPTFDVDADDDQLLNMEVEDDLLEVFDKEIPVEDLEDFEDEKASLK